MARHYDDYDEPEECDHEDYESDILTGRAYCDRCRSSWYLSNDEIEAEHRRIEEYDEWQRSQQRRERWDRITWPFRWLWYRALNRVAPRTAVQPLRDDEIPF